MLEILQREEKHICLLGDFNVDLSPNSESNIGVEEFKNTFSSHHLYPLINKPTRVMHNTKSTIDHIFSNYFDCKNIYDVGILMPHISDHHAIFCFVNNITTKKENQVFTKYLRNFFCSQRSLK